MSKEKKVPTAEEIVEGWRKWAEEYEPRELTPEEKYRFQLIRWMHECPIDPTIIIGASAASPFFFGLKKMKKAIE